MASPARMARMASRRPADGVAWTTLDPSGAAFSIRATRVRGFPVQQNNDAFIAKGTDCEPRERLAAQKARGVPSYKPWSRRLTDGTGVPPCQPASKPHKRKGK